MPANSGLDLSTQHKRPRITARTWLLLAVVLLVLGGGALLVLPRLNSRSVTWAEANLRAWVLDRLFSGGDTLPVAADGPDDGGTSPVVEGAPTVLASFNDVQSATATAQPATPTPAPTDQPSPTPGPTATEVDFNIIDPPATHQLEGVRFEYQDLANCGPTTLAMGLSYWGWEGNQRTISDVLKPVSKDQNVRWDELVYYVKNYAGWLDALFRVGGEFEMIELFVANGYPVIVETGYYVNNTWVGHYLLVTGYDRDLRVLTVQDATGGPNRYMTYDEVDELWQQFNRLYIIVFPSDKLDKINAMLGEDADEDLNRQHALRQSEADVERDPGNAFFWHNLGSNLAYFERYEEAAEAFDQAREIGLPRRMLFYQFGTYHAYFNVGRYQDVYDLADYTLAYRPDLEENYFWRGWAAHMLGDTGQAIADFNRALDVNPNFNDAVLALEYFGAR